MPRVERIVFAGGAEWGIEEFMSVVQRDEAGNDYLYGRDDSIDFFDSSAGGNDYLYGGAGADIYILGKKTSVYEGFSAAVFNAARRPVHQLPHFPPATISALGCQHQGLFAKQ